MSGDTSAEPEGSGAVSSEPRRRDNPEARMRFVEHLRELRQRIVKVLIGLAVAAIPAWFAYPFVFEALQSPVMSLNDADLRAALVFDTPPAAIDMRLKVSLWLAAFASSPWWLYQLWAFIAPGLTRPERRYGVVFVAVGVPLFLLGAALAAVVLPNAVRILLSFAPEGALSYMSAGHYLRFVMRIVLAFGLAFLIPLVMIVTNALGLVHSRTLLRGWRWAVLAIFFFGALASPTPDPWTMIAIAIPICGLYFGAVAITARRDKRRDAAEEA